MLDDKKNIETDRLHSLLLQHKYHSAVKKLTKGVTHEYNNIFMGLSGQMRIGVKEDGKGDFSAKRVQLIEELLRRGTEKTELLFEFSRDIESIKKFHSPGRLAVKGIDLLNSVSRLHQFSLHVEDDLPKIYSKYREIILMLFYLGENGIEAMDEGGEIQLELSSIQKADESLYVRFRMTDNGTGFSDDMKTGIFEPLYTTKSERNVSGIGLYAVKTIVDDHGGKLNIEGASGGGTSVTVDIPVIQKGKDNGTGELRLRCSPQRGRHRKKHIFLVVDDEQAIRDLLQNRIQRRGHVAYCVASCKEAVEKFRILSDTVTVALVDVGLRDATGYECARQLLMINEDVCIIMMSGSNADLRTMPASRAAFIKKPFSVEQVEQMVGDAELHSKSNK
ncbi:MAG: hybrid sensor histidine kinase/response regulator [Desulfobulbaceae bacterium]|nr:hybrid sensor histidine kinase/response regulator [Desulfobulbaceae bacterium]